MKISMNKFILAGLGAVVLALSFSPQAHARSAVSISFSDDYGGYRHHYSRHHHGYDHYDRHAYRSYKKFKRAMRRVERRAERRAERRFYHSFVAAHTAPIIYQNVITQPAPLLANQASPTYSRDGQTCREYQSDIVIGGRTQPSYGTACLQQDGAWRIVD